MRRTRNRVILGLLLCVVGAAVELFAIVALLFWIVGPLVEVMHQPSSEGKYLGLPAGIGLAILGGVLIWVAQRMIRQRAANES